MKVLFVLMSFFSFVFSTELSEFISDNAYENNYVIALEKAKNEKKNLMFVVVDKNCPWCVKLEENTLSNKAVDAQIKKENVALIMQRTQKEFPNDYDSKFTPYVYFINPLNEEVLYESIGYKAPQAFLEEVKEVSF